MDRLPFSGAVSTAERTISIGALGPGVTWTVAGDGASKPSGGVTVRV